MQERDVYPVAGSQPVATVSDAMDRFGVADGIRPLWRGAVLSGPAFTVWTRPGDNKGLHAAFEEIRRGEVLVVNGGGDSTRALIGELVAQKAKALQVGGSRAGRGGAGRGGVGGVGGSGVRAGGDACRAVEDGPFRVGCTIAVGGVPVSPGDWVVGDGDGVAVVPRGEVEVVVARVGELIAGEAERRAANQALVPRG